MIASVMSFCCRTVGAVQAPLTAPVMRQCGYYNTCSRLKPTPVGVGLQRFRRACTAAAPDGVAVRNSWGAQDRTTEIRELRSLNDWISSCASNWQGFTAYEGYAAIRKLVEVCCQLHVHGTFCLQHGYPEYQSALVYVCQT